MDDVLILANPVAEGVAGVDGEAVGDAEGDVDGLAEDEVRDMSKVWLVVVL